MTIQPNASDENWPDRPLYDEENDEHNMKVGRTIDAVTYALCELHGVQPEEPSEAENTYPGGATIDWYGWYVETVETVLNQSELFQLSLDDKNELKQYSLYCEDAEKYYETCERYDETLDTGAVIHPPITAHVSFRQWLNGKRGAYTPGLQ